MAKRFQRKVENFTCEHCNERVIGNGYTNHCPNCLWSKHVDINPGDRQAGCQGLMEPIGVEQKRGGFVLVHRCVHCQFQRKNRVSEADNFDTILAISSCSSSVR